MPMDRTELAKRIYEKSHLTGRFLLRSGKYSERYFDKYQFEADPVLLEATSAGMAGLLPEGTQLLGGLEMGGIPLAAAISLQTKLPTLFVRKKAKEYGTCRLAEGPDPRGRKVCLIEDVITTGGAVMDAAKALRNMGAEVTAVVCAIYRGEEKANRLGDLPMRPLFTLADFTP